MFIGIYELENKTNFNLYYKNFEGWRLWYKNTFSPLCENIKILDFKIEGKKYKEKKAYLINLAIDWQTNYSGLNWSYSELIEIQNFFEKNAKRYGLIKEFKENGII